MAFDVLSKIGIGKASELAGIDIGTTSITVCSLKSSKSGFELIHLARRSYREDLIRDGTIVDREFVAKEIKDIFAENKIRAKHAGCALSSYVVITKVVTMPALADKEMESSISLEVENAIPFPLDDVWFGYYVTGFSEERTDMVNVQIAAAKKEICQGYIDTMKMAGLSLDVLDVDLFGITNLIMYVYNPRDTAALAVDLGASTTNMAIIKDESIQFTREIFLGGKQLTQKIQETMEVSFDEAEEMKKNGNESATYLFEDFVHNVTSEINKTLKFYMSIKPKETITKIYLTGGSSLLKGLKDRVAAETGIEVESIDPFLLVGKDRANTPSLDEYRSFSSIALYLATRVAETTGL
jgi:type IV pilus assembly protein PilM